MFCSKHFAETHLLDFWARPSCRPRGAPCVQTSSCSWRSTGGTLSKALKLRRRTMEVWRAGAERRGPRPGAARRRSRGPRRFPRGCGSSGRSKRCPSSYSGCRWSWGWRWPGWWRAWTGPGWRPPCGPDWCGSGSVSPRRRCPPRRQDNLIKLELHVEKPKYNYLLGADV